MIFLHILCYKENNACSTNLTIITLKLNLEKKGKTNRFREIGFVLCDLIRHICKYTIGKGVIGIHLQHFAQKKIFFYFLKTGRKKLDIGELSKQNNFDFWVVVVNNANLANTKSANRRQEDVNLVFEQQISSVAENC